MNIMRYKLSCMVLMAVFLKASLSFGQAVATPDNGFTELSDPASPNLENWARVDKGLQISFASIDKRYPKSEVPNLLVQKQHMIKGWKGERLSAQILLWTTDSVPEVTVAFSDFRAVEKKGPTIPASIASARFVRYVMTDEYGKGCGRRKPEDYAASLSADMLDHLDRFYLEANKVRPVWLTVDVPRTAQAGRYLSQIQIKGKGVRAQSLTLTLEIIDQLLPKSSEWTFHLDQWQHPAAVARVENLPLWSDAHFQAMKPTMQMLADAGQKVITATLNKDPWNNQCFDAYQDMIIWTKQTDGTWSYDYSVFDRWVSYMMNLGIKDMINCYSMIPWNNEIHYKDAATNTFLDVVAKPGTAVFEAMWTPFLLDFTQHLQKKGWLEITNIAIDERDRESMDATLTFLRKVAPQLGVSYADNQKSYHRYPNSEDISVSVDHPVAHEDIVDRRSRGLNTTFYVCCSDPFPNQFTFSDPAESAYLAWYAKATDLDGLLRWAFNSWVEKPLVDSRFRTWPAGDTYIVYPQGRSSIRYERMLEGIQDYEKIRIVENQLEKAGDQDALNRLHSAIEKLDSMIRTDSWNKDLNEAKKLLNELSMTTT